MSGLSKWCMDWAGSLRIGPWTSSIQLQRPGQQKETPNTGVGLWFCALGQKEDTFTHVVAYEIQRQLAPPFKNWINLTFLFPKHGSGDENDVWRRLFPSMKHPWWGILSYRILRRLRTSYFLSNLHICWIHLETIKMKSEVWELHFTWFSWYICPVFDFSI